MWIVMNNSYVSIVKDRTNTKNVVVRARVKEDLENLFKGYEDKIIETEDSDYRFRLFLDKSYVGDVIKNQIEDIEYDNFKNSVKQSWRKLAYTKIWQIMYDVQHNTYGTGYWWQDYKKSG